MNGEPINFTKIAKNCKISVKTAQEYFQILVDTLLVARIDGWSESMQKQLLQSPKYYFLDCGVLNALTGELLSELKTSSFRYGKLFETWLIQEMIRESDYLRLQLRFNYWRTSTNHEVDFIISRTIHKPLAAIEIKSGESPDASEFGGLNSFAIDYPKVPQFCFCNTPRSYRVGEIHVLPWRDGIDLLKSL